MQTLPFPTTQTDRMAVRHFRNSIPRRSRREFDAALATVLATETNHAVDQTTQGHLIFGGSVLCIYRHWLREGLGNEAAKAKVQHATTKFLKRSTKLMMQLTVLFSKDPFETIKRYTIEMPQKVYGSSFEFEYAELEDGFVSIVNRCGFQAFLERHGADELLDVFCEWDRTWIDALPKSIAFERPTTLAQGGKACRFEFLKRR